MGNPCFEFPHYREFCIATLPQLQFLDGQPIERSERILALQKLEKVRLVIIDCEIQHKEKRKIEKSEAEREIASKKSEYDDPNLDLDTQRQKFYQSSSKHTPGKNNLDLNIDFINQRLLNLKQSFAKSHNASVSISILEMLVTEILLAERMTSFWNPKTGKVNSPRIEDCLMTMASHLILTK